MRPRVAHSLPISGAVLRRRPKGQCGRVTVARNAVNRPSGGDATDHCGVIMSETSCATAVSEFRRASTCPIPAPFRVRKVGHSRPSIPSLQKQSTAEAAEAAGENPNHRWDETAKAKLIEPQRT